MATSEMLLQQVKDEGSATMLQLREQMQAAHDADRQLLIAEMQQLQARMTMMRQLAHKGKDTQAPNLPVW